jgi:hypothetical protein
MHAILKREEAMKWTNKKWKVKVMFGSTGWNYLGEIFEERGLTEKVVGMIRSRDLMPLLPPDVKPQRIPSPMISIVIYNQNP